MTQSARKQTQTPLPFHLFSHGDETLRRDAFSQGWTIGKDACSEDLEEGERLQTEQDVWLLLSREISPAAIQGDQGEAFDRYPTDQYPPLAFRVGFLVGYLQTAFASARPLDDEAETAPQMLPSEHPFLPSKTSTH